MVWLKINHNKWNVILKYKEQKVEPEQPWCKFMRICSWRATPRSKRGGRGADKKRALRKEKWKQPEAKPEPRRSPESCSACQSTASPGHWSIWGTTNPKGRLPGYKTSMWKTLQVVFCFSRDIFFQKNSLLSGFRRNPLWSQNQMGKCLTPCRVLSVRRKPKCSYLETRMRLQVENSERAAPGSCSHRLFWMLQKKIKYRLYHFAVVSLSGVGNGKVVWFICSMLK